MLCPFQPYLSSRAAMLRATKYASIDGRPFRVRQYLIWHKYTSFSVGGGLPRGSNLGILAYLLPTAVELQFASIYIPRTLNVCTEVCLLPASVARNTVPPESPNHILSLTHQKTCCLRGTSSLGTSTAGDNVPARIPRSQSRRGGAVGPYEHHEYDSSAATDGKTIGA